MPERLAAGFVLSVLLLWGCAKESSPTETEKERFKNFYTDLMILQELEGLAGSVGKIREEKIERLHRDFALTREDEAAMLGYYQRSLPEWDKFLVEIKARIEARKSDRAAFARLRGHSAAASQDTSKPHN